MTEEAPVFRAGFATLAGRPNAGKSTLLNALVGGKLAIVSEKPQTTRTSIQAVMTTPEAQVVFLDTPGIHESGTLLNRRMMETVRSALEDRDVLLYLTDCSASWGERDEEALRLVKDVATPALLVLTKADLLQDKRYLLPRIEQCKAVRDFDEFLPVSAKTGEGLDKLRAAVVARMPESEAFFPPDYITDQPERFLAAELIREKILEQTQQEVPHSVAVVVERWEETKQLTRIAATVFVERPGQKAIVIGAKGAMLKRIGTEARHEIEALLERKVFLELFVKVQAGWRENPEFLRAIDWRSLRGRELDADRGSE